MESQCKKIKTFKSSIATKADLIEFKVDIIKYCFIACLTLFLVFRIMFNTYLGQTNTARKD